MKAVRIHAYGDENVLQYEDAPMPELRDEDVLIKVCAASVNPIDWQIREGTLRERLSHTLPLIPGWDLSGVIEELGPKVDKFDTGDEVYSRPNIRRDGSYAQYIAVNAGEVALKPTSLSHAEAASIPFAGIAAWEAIVRIGKVEQGRSVLIHGASGGVGCLAVQLAKLRGAYVFGTTSRNMTLVEDLGVDAVINYEANKFYKMAANVDLVLDTIGGETQEKSWGLLKLGGILLSTVEQPSSQKAKAFNARGVYMRSRPNAEYLRQLAGLIDEGKIRPVMGHEFALQEVREAHLLSQSHHARGKIVLHVEHGENDSSEVFA